jgi:gas vesicle protein
VAVTWFLLGLVVGATIGALAMALLVASRERRRD